MDISSVINILRLEPLKAEGGMYRPTYYSADTLPGGRPVGSAIYYLLGGGAFSHLHSLDADEIYHFYMGDPVELTQIDPEGKLTTTVLGHDLAAGQQVQAVVAKGVWQGSRLLPGGSFALMGTTMSPSYTDASYMHGERGLLLQKFPRLKDEVIRLTSSAAPV